MDVVKNLVLRVLALLVALGGLTTALAAPATAHDRIIGSDPADGSALTVSPTQIVLTFSDEVQQVGGQILLVDAAGTQVAAGPPAVDGTTATLAVPTLANGPYTVTWRVVSSDGHPIDGTFAFSVADPAAVGVEPAPEVTALDVPAEEPTTAPADETSAEPTPSTAPSTADDDADDDGLPWTGIIIGGLLGLAAGVGLLELSKRRARAKKD